MTLMHIGVIHNSMNNAGGAEKVCLVIIEALKRSGYEVELATTEPTDWSRLSRIIGTVMKPDKEMILLPYKIRVFGIYLRLLSNLYARKLRKKVNLIINTNAEILQIQSDIIYLHFPMFALLKETPTNVKYTRSLGWKIYFKPYEWIQGHLVRKLLEKSLILTNSNYSAKAIKKYTGKDAVVLYPPVDVESFLCDTDNRKDIVVSCGRYSPEKNYEFMLEVAARMRDTEFIIMGGSSGNVSTSYYKKIESIKQEKDLHNVKLLKDVPVQQQIEIYKTANVYLHCMIGEHFGLAVVEAMASGLIPIVHRSGGAWEDIVEYGKCGYGYENLDEAVDAINNVKNSSDAFRKQIIERSKTFSKRRFMEGFLARINERI